MRRYPPIAEHGMTHLALIFAATTLGGELERRTQRGTRLHGGRGSR